MKKKKKFRMMYLYPFLTNSNRKIERYISWRSRRREVARTVRDLKYNLTILNDLTEINHFINKYKNDRELIKILKSFKSHIKYQEYLCELFTFNVRHIKLLKKLIDKYENLLGRCCICNKKIKLNLGLSVWKKDKFYYFCSFKCEYEDMIKNKEWYKKNIDYFKEWFNDVKKKIEKENETI